MDMDAFISELLHQHECVIVPGLGGFLTSYAPASIHPLLHVFVPPSKHIVFNASLSLNDGILAKHLSARRNISYGESLDIINHWINDHISQLRRGQNWTLENIGTLALDREGNMQFEPSHHINYLADSYGLSNFVSPPIKRNETGQTIAPVKQGITFHRIGKGLKWAAIALPLIGLASWGSFHVKDIDQLYVGYANLMPWATTPSNISPAVKSINSAGMLFTDYQTIYASVLADRSGMFPLHKAAIAAPVNQTEVSNESAGAENINLSPNLSRYSIIGGAFGLLENAGKYVDELKGKGFPASILYKNRRGLYIVGITGFQDKQTAKAQLSLFRSTENKAAWLIAR
jgi:hypothetical protein